MRSQSWLGSSNANKEGNSKLEVMGAYDIPPPQSMGRNRTAAHKALQGLQHPSQAKQTSNTGLLEMPILGAQLSHWWKRSHFCSPIAQDAFWCAASVTQQCNSSQWANVSANNIVKHLQRNKPSKSKLHPFPNHYSPKPSELSQAGASFQRGRSQSIISSVLCQFQETVSLMCGRPMAQHLHPRTDPQLHPAYPRRTQPAQASFCFSAWAQVSAELLMGGYFDPSKATVERKQNSTDNPT